MQYVRCFRLYVSANSAALPMSHWRYELCITYPYYASLSGACTWEGYGLRITYRPYYVSSAESPPERAMYYALRIRIMYQAPKARRRGLWTTHYVSVLCIKRRTITRGEHNIHDARDRPETDPRPTRDRPETDPRTTRDRPETDPRSTRD